MKKVAICIGHNKKHQGAVSLFLNSTEFAYNSRVAALVKAQLGTSVDLYNRKFFGSYTKEMEDLSHRVNQENYTAVIELHFNAAVPGVEGCEALHFHTSKAGQYFADTFCDAIVEEYGSRNRGAKPLSKDTDRGYGFVQKMKAPAIIVEPFFGSNREALEFVNVKRYADTLTCWIEEQML